MNKHRHFTIQEEADIAGGKAALLKVAANFSLLQEKLLDIEAAYKDATAQYSLQTGNGLTSFHSGTIIDAGGTVVRRMNISLKANKEINAKAFDAACSILSTAMQKPGTHPKSKELKAVQNASQAAMHRLIGKLEQLDAQMDGNVSLAASRLTHKIDRCIAFINDTILKDMARHELDQRLAEASKALAGGTSRKRYAYFSNTVLALALLSGSTFLSGSKTLFTDEQGVPAEEPIKTAAATLILSALGAALKRDDHVERLKAERSGESAPSR